MQIIVLSRWKMVELVKKDPHLLFRAGVISINDPGEKSPLAEIDDGTVLNLYFQDFDDVQPLPGDVFFTPEMGESVIQWLENTRPCEDPESTDCLCGVLYIHCHAGVSRSGAVGTFAREYLRANFEDFKRRNPQICPNPLVLKTLRKLAFGSYEE